MSDFQPKKLPRQARSRASFNAIVEACARVLRERGYGGLTTNHVADEAGVSIGALYEFFPNKDSIVAILLERRLDAMIDEVGRMLEAALSAPDEQRAAELLIEGVVEVVSADRDLFRVLMREVPFTAGLPVTQRTIAAAFDLARRGAERATGRLNLPHLEADTWLVNRMVYQAVLEIAFAGSDAPDRDVLTRELVRLTVRMLQGRDPQP